MDIQTPNGYLVDTREHRAMFYASAEWRRLREEVMRRDRYECVWCAREGKVSTNQVLEIDHIHELEYYPSEALDIDNLRTLCKDCHNKRHNRFNYKSKDKNKKCKKYSTVNYDEWW